jgi:hypothetical protein
MWGLLLVDALVVGSVVRIVAWLSVWLVHPQLILLEFVAVVAVAWKNVLVHFWRSQLLNVLQHCRPASPLLTAAELPPLPSPLPLRIAY